MSNPVSPVEDGIESFASAHKAVVLFDGRTSKPGAGSVFRALLPVTQPPAVAV